MNRLPPFAYFAPRSVPEAVEILAREGPTAALLAGGTDLLVRAKRGRAAPRAVVNLKHIAALSGIEPAADGLRLGALTTIAALLHSELIRLRYPVLAEAAAQLGSVAVRNLATLGGNIGRASPASDLAPALIVLAAIAEVQGPDGTRTVGVENFFRGPGVSVLAPGEIITGFYVPAAPANSRATYERLGRTQGVECALVGVAAYLELTGDRACAARLALASVAPVPLRARAAEAVLLSAPLTDALLDAAAAAAAAESMPITDLRATADYRRRMVHVIARRALRRLLAPTGGRP